MAHEERVNEENGKFKDLMKSDPVTVKIMIREHTSAELAKWREAEKASRRAATSFRIAGPELDSFREEIKLRKMAIGES
jgi:hypothetical protein